jgi:hypothetical protein
MSALRFGGQLFAAVVAGGSIGPSMMQIAECAKEVRTRFLMPRPPQLRLTLDEENKRCKILNVLL